MIPLLGVWDSYKEIDFGSLPDKFVLKCTHDSGGLVICRDKSALNKKAVRKKLEKCLRTNPFHLGRVVNPSDIVCSLVTKHGSRDPFSK